MALIPSGSRAGSTQARSMLRRRSSLLAVGAATVVGAMVLVGCGSGAGQSSLAAAAQSVQGSGAQVAAPDLTETSAPAPVGPAVSTNPSNGATGVSTVDPITATVADGQFESVKLTNADGKEIPGVLADDKNSWSTTPELGYGKKYVLTATARNADGGVTESVTTFTTVTPSNFTALRTFPSDGMTVGVAQPISFNFDEPITDREAAEKAITVTTTPKQQGGFRWITDQELRWRPAEFWQSGTTVSIEAKIYGQELGEGMYGQGDVSTSFTIGRSMVAAIDDNTHQMVVKQDGQVIKTMPVSLGSDTYPTYNGVHVVAEKYTSKIMDSSTWGLTGAGAYRTEVQWATRISSSGEFVHAAPWSVQDQGSRNVSHGCVNVSTENAKWFHDNFMPGDPVIITNTSGPELQVWDGYGDFQMPFEQYISAA